MGSTEKTYWSKEIADLLGIGTSTLRKYCLLLEENGYRFLRDEHDRRAYTEHDAIALRKLQDLTKDKAMTLENAVIAVISTHNRSVYDTVTGSATSVIRYEDRSVERYAERYADLEEKFDLFADRQEKFNQALLDQFQMQQDYIENSLKVRDENLMRVIREMQETKMLQLAALEEQKQQQKEEKKWWRFW